jgi:hypothetical protein
LANGKTEYIFQKFASYAKSLIVHSDSESCQPQYWKRIGGELLSR